MPAKNHLHTYRRINGEKGQTRFSCSDPECSHIALKSTLIGKRSLCPYCGGEMILSGTSLRLSMPHCGCLSGKAPPLTAHRSELGDTLSIANSLLERLSKKEGDEEDEGQS